MSVAERRRPFIFNCFQLVTILNGGLNLVFLVVLCAIQEILIYHVGLLSAQFYYILLLKDVHKFYLQLIITFMLILFMSIVKSGSKYVTSVLYIEWRQHISDLLIEKYFQDVNYYSLNQATHLNQCDGGDIGHNKIENIDQRLSHDIDKFCSELSAILSKIILSPFTVLYYSFQVYRIIGLFGLISCFSIFAISTFVNRFFIASIIKWTYRKGKHEGDYRTEHTNIVKNYEQIALTNAEDKQKTILLKLLSTLLAVYENLIFNEFFLNVSTTIFDYSGSILSFIIIAIPIFNGTFDYLNEAELSRTISSNAFICMYLINCFSKIVDISSEFGQIYGFGYRIVETFETLQSNLKLKSNQKVDYHRGLVSTHVLLKLDHVQFSPPFFVQIFIQELTFSVYELQNVHIICDSGKGKTSILRIIKGLWPITSGKIEWNINVNDMHQVMFVTHDSMYAQYFIREMFNDTKCRSNIVQYLNDYELEFILNVNKSAIMLNMLDNLSPGQIQILNLLIVFVIKPKLVFLDDATNSLSETLVGKLYNECCRLSITIVTIASDDKLKKFHVHSIRV
ncbi:hypothetical protein RDWZM_000668 [Blomia tropicalis]|uniref:ABC transmembrane type-1 domain-containing protein n=1 Tax=Blomia tropicalis TaxID=40697 RepID=A0A9Q0M9A5_BLOTA|nr:ATP-binding cassette sub- D member 4 [Blomia tropicalis]KAJ6222123.1 hypothetical protein RDWZM_000668 [Blomia tropicalis]